MSDHHTFTLDEIEQRTGFDKRTIAYYVQQGLLPKVGRRGPKTRYPQNFLDRLQFVNLIREKQDLGEMGSLTLAEIRDILDRVPPDAIADVLAGDKPLRLVNVGEDLEPPASMAAPDVHAAQILESALRSPTLAEEVAEISESIMGLQQDRAATLPDFNRQVRLGLMDPNSPATGSIERNSKAAAGATIATPSRLKAGLADDGDQIRPPRRYEDEIQKKDQDAKDLDAKTESETDETATNELSPPPIEIERLGWFLARLQRAMTGDRRRRTGTTESWHRALVTPELTISARNLKDADAYLLDAVARILKKLLWEAWEE